MKNFSLLAIAALTCALAVSCEKPMNEAEKNAQIEREVQQRLAAERQAEDQQRLAQQQADLEAREQALADKEASAADKVVAAIPRPTARPVATADTRTRTSSSRGETASSYDTFYRKLEPYGAWRETADYGYVYQPKEAQKSRNWRPYTDGRWAYTDAGWTWVSTEPFGWATYHYGRWTRLRGVGWVWVPGDEWAPAWVSWRKSDEHVGWAPLPPEARFEHGTGIHKWADSYYDIDADEYVFIPNEEIGSEHIERAVIPAERNVTIVNETTNVTNITYSNTTIINEGPSYDELRSRSRQPFERSRIERRYEVGEEQAPQAVVRGGVIAMLTPLFTGRATERPRSVGEPIRQVTVERNWASGGNQPEAERVRAKMKAEATPPPNAPAKSYDKPIVEAAPPIPAATAPSSTPAMTAAPLAAEPASPSASPRPTTRAFTPQPSVEPTTSTPSPTPTATATPKPTAVATATPIATSTPTATPTATATPTPTATLTPTPSPIATPKPRPTSTPLPSATPQPTAVVEQSPEMSLTPRPTPPIAGKPLVTPTPIRAVSPDDSGVEETPHAPPPLGGGDLRQMRDAARGEKPRGNDAARNAKLREKAAAMQGAASPAPSSTPLVMPPPPVPPRSVVTPPPPLSAVAPTVAPPIIPPPATAAPATTPVDSLPTPAVEKTTSRLSDLDQASPAASPVESASVPPTAQNPRGKKKPKPEGKPGQNVDVPDSPEATPSDASPP